MYDMNTTFAGTEFSSNQGTLMKISTPFLNLRELKESFYFVPVDKYFESGSRYRTTSRIQITEDGYELLPRRPLYQPVFVNDLNSYGGIDRDYDDVPASLLKTKSFDIMIREWLAPIPFKVETFSIHQIRTADNGNPTPEGAHRDGTDWTGILIVNRHNISDESGATQYWDLEGNQLVDHVFPEGTLITHYDKFFTHCATPIAKLNLNEPSFRDVFVLTTPEHGVNREQEEFRRENLVAQA